MRYPRLVGSAGKNGQESVQGLQYQIEGATYAQGVGVVFYIHAGSAQVDDAAGGGAALGEGLYLGHEVMPDLRLYFEGAPDI